MYVSECCGGVFVSGHGPDNIVEAEAGTQLVLGPVEDRPPHSNLRKCRSVTASEEALYDAVRAGDCPACDRQTPGLQLLDPEEVGL
jgi:hypothetical protein